MKTAPTSMQWGMGEVYNVSEVAASHWHWLDAHTAYLAAVRMLQTPVIIGERSGTWLNDVFGGAPRWTQLVHANATNLRVQMLAFHWQGLGGLVYNLSQNAGASWVTGTLTPTKDSFTGPGTVDDAGWVVTDPQMAADAPVSTEPNPPPVTVTATEAEAWIWLQFAAVAPTIFALWIQPYIRDGAGI